MTKPRFTRRHSFILRWSGLSLAGTVAMIGVVLIMSRQQRMLIPAAGANVEGLTSVLSKQVGSEERVPLQFDDVTAEAGIAFRHFPASRSSLIAEDVGSGMAWGDYDNDGKVDLFVVNFVGPVTRGASLDREAGRSRLYRNLGGGRFEDATVSSGIDFAGYGMGAAWGDYDSDGDLDLYLTAYGENALYENLGQGRFRDGSTSGPCLSSWPARRRGATTRRVLDR